VRGNVCPSLRSPWIYAIVVTLTVLSTVIPVILGGMAAPIPVVVLAIAVIVTGIPHGAVDHLVAAELFDLRFTWRDQLRFYGTYLLLMGIYAVSWIVAPKASLVFFLLLTMYHFGQADLAYWDLPPLRARVAYLSRGLFLIGLPIVAFPGVVDPLFHAIGGMGLRAVLDGAMHGPLFVGGLVAQHGLVLGVNAMFSDVERMDVSRELVSVGVLGGLFSLVHPLLAFAVYFGLWHSLGHILELTCFFRRRGTGPSTLSDFYKKAALFSVLSFGGLGAVYALTGSLGVEEQMVAYLFILIAVLTLPHVIVVEAMYWARTNRFADVLDGWPRQGGDSAD